MAEVSMRTGIRQNLDDLAASKIAKRSSKFRLIEQPNFTGSDELLSEMQNYERAYRDGRPEITDEEWDALVKQTSYIESLETTVSPNGRLWVKLKSPLVSLNKATSIASLKEYFDSFPVGQSFVVGPKLDGLTFCAIYAECDDGSFSRIYITTRGDGINGLKLYDNALYGTEIYGIPEVIPAESADKLKELGCVVDGVVEIRGEAVINRDNYSKVGSNNNYSDILARSIAAGIFNRKEPNNLAYFIHKNFPEDIEYCSMTKEQKSCLAKNNVVGKKSKYDFADIVNSKLMVHDPDLDMLLDISKCEDTGKIRVIETLSFLAFSISSIYGNIEGNEIFKSIPGVEYYGYQSCFSDIWEITSDFGQIIKSVDVFYGTTNGERDMAKPRLKNTMKFACDGIVVKPLGSNKDTQKLAPKKKSNGGYVLPHHPSDQIAIKLPTDAVRSKILEIVYKETNLGNTTVSAKIVPVTVEGGAVVSQVNLHNPNWLSIPENSWIKEGADIDLRMSMDIIPIISEVK